MNPRPPGASSIEVPEGNAALLPAGDPPLRLALLLNNPFTSDSRSWKLARSLAAAGCSVTVVARRAPGLPDREELEGYRVVRLDQPRPFAWLPVPPLPEARSAVSWSNGAADATGPTIRSTSMLGRARRAAFEVVGRAMQAARYLVLARQWAKRIADEVPTADIWQAEGLIILPVALALRRRRGGRVVYDVRDLQVDSARFARLPSPWRRLLARRERAWARAADAMITANRPYAEVIERNLGVRPTVVLNGPLAAEAVHPAPVRQRLSLDPGTRIVLYLGNVAPSRGVEQLCSAIASVANAVLLVVGPGGPFRERLRLAAAESPAADRIHFLPEVAPADIPAWTAAADIAAMPIQPTTLNHRLTTPTRLFDALGAGVPVVASDSPGMAEIVRETGCGILCDPTDPVDIARALREVLDGTPERRIAFREAALAAARGPYAWSGQIERLLEVYRALATD